MLLPSIAILRLFYVLSAISNVVNGGDWNGWSLNSNNDCYQREELPQQLPLTNMSHPSQFIKRGFYKTSGVVTATPIVYHGRVYFPDLNGTIYCLNETNGKLMWNRHVSPILNYPTYPARVSPVVYGDQLILGIQTSTIADLYTSPGSVVFSLNRFTGQLKWRKRVDTHPASIITSTPVIIRDLILIGVSSKEEVLAV
ncbi:unnamed protein product [Didymodactylos carnosus]|uniref:Pyrrolo-quinoline quinone repeat domain-containing protein n=1 Tax=Didymodactylos carnosus TaxID=1234261 RepID=A0A814LUS2_9BILA|nr:unnamed protein product [Didymodactylos carnosus]CAF3836804.1 unnamed protein product [Didymodactylos carnosus]